MTEFKDRGRTLPQLKLEKGAIAVIITFVIIFIVGVCVFKDYGISVDEPAQRNHTRIAFNTIYKQIFDRDYYEGITDITEYSARFYGTAIQIPPLLIEIIFKLKDSRDIFLVKHFYSFLLYFASLICFYFINKRFFKSRLFAILGVLMLFLYPRFFGNSFFDIKNLAFASLLIIALYFILVFLEKRQFSYAILAGFLVALATNSRWIALMLVGAVALVILLEVLVAKSEVRHRRLSLLHLLVFAAVFFISFILLTPASWANPSGFLVEYVKSFSNGWEAWDGTFVFNGELIKKATMPRYYVPVWMGITIPICYLLLSAIGIVSVVKRALTGGIKAGFLSHLYELVPLGMFLIPVLATVLKRGLLYIEWRHLFFCYPLLMILALFGLHWVMEYGGWKKWTMVALVVLTLLTQAGWIVKNHPYEVAYFNVIGRQVAAKYDRDSWGVCTYQLLQYLAENTEAVPAKVKIGMDRPSLGMLPKQLRERIKTVSDIAEAEYTTSYYRNIIGNAHAIEGFEEIYTIWVDGFKIGSLYKRIN
ncbi:MAG: glycosyltransferase family 39 protein [Clostridiales bacterium]|nr:glycosyltransferase family 39 protein [Clostridiales bacterium]